MISCSADSLSSSMRARRAETSVALGGENNILSADKYVAAHDEESPSSDETHFGWSDPGRKRRTSSDSCESKPE